MLDGTPLTTLIKLSRTSSLALISITIASILSSNNSDFSHSIGRMASFSVQVWLNHAFPTPMFTMLPDSALTTKQVPIEAKIPSLIIPSNKRDI